MWSRLWKGLKATLPIALSVAPFGIAYGAVASRSLAPWQVGLMSLTVFAGTAQFVAASMLAQGTAYLPILITGILLNVRLVLMSAALTPHVKRAPRALYPIMAPAAHRRDLCREHGCFRARAGRPALFRRIGDSPLQHLATRHLGWPDLRRCPPPRPGAGIRPAR